MNFCRLFCQSSWPWSLLLSRRNLWIGFFISYTFGLPTCNLDSLVKYVKVTYQGETHKGAHERNKVAYLRIKNGTQQQHALQECCCCCCCCLSCFVLFCFVFAFLCVFLFLVHFAAVLEFAWHDNRFVCCLDVSAPWLSHSAQSPPLLSACCARTVITKHRIQW